MELNNNRIYTTINADKLSVGDLVITADAFAKLKDRIKENRMVVELTFILGEDKDYRFGVDYNYALAYLVCPKRNVAAYKAWHEGKTIEFEDELIKDVWHAWTMNGEPDWVTWNYRVATMKYRPYKDTVELIADYCERFNKTYDQNCELPAIWIRRETCFAQIQGFDSTTVTTTVHDCLSMAELVSHKFVYVDGSPVGKKIEE